MTDDTRDVLLRQLDIAWKLTQYHLEGLSTEECLWRPARAGLHVHQTEDGRWQADWPEHEAYALGPPSIAWVTWHIVFWWSMVLDHSFGDGRLGRADVEWPGSADALRAKLGDLVDRWRTAVTSLAPEELRSMERARWPLADRPFADVVAWANLELAKNAAELGYARFLYAVRHPPENPQASR